MMQRLKISLEAVLLLWDTILLCPSRTLYSLALAHLQTGHRSFWSLEEVLHMAIQSLPHCQRLVTRHLKLDSLQGTGHKIMLPARWKRLKMLQLFGSGVELKQRLAARRWSGQNVWKGGGISTESDIYFILQVPTENKNVVRRGFWPSESGWSIDSVTPTSVISPRLRIQTQSLQWLRNIHSSDFESSSRVIITPYSTNVSWDSCVLFKLYFVCRFPGWLLFIWTPKAWAERVT